jgi:hypothetical protein
MLGMWEFDMDAVEKLLAIEEIKVLKARYFRLMDTRQWDQWEQLFIPDFVAEFPDDQKDALPLRGRTEFVEMTKSLHGKSLSIHHGYMPEIEITSPTTARAVWAMQDIMKWPEGGATKVGARSLLGWGHYHETYIKSVTGWRIASTKLTRLDVQLS